MALKGTCKVLQKVHDDEEIFVLRAQDSMASVTILDWIKNNWHASDEKLREAFECALRMRKYPGMKACD